MKFDKRIVAVGACVMALSLTQCSSDPTAPSAPRTRSVATTVSVPATPTAPITLSTNDPESQVSIVLDVPTLQAMVALAGGPVTVKLTDMAPVDFASQLPASERALIGKSGKLVMSVLVYDITRSSANAVGSTAAAVASYSSIVSKNAVLAGTQTFSMKNNTGKRCTPGVVDLLQIFGVSSNLLTSSINIDDATPLQNITGTATATGQAVLHFIFDFECPRVTASGAP